MTPSWDGEGYLTLILFNTLSDKRVTPPPLPPLHGLLLNAPMLSDLLVTPINKAILSARPGTALSWDRA